MQPLAERLRPKTLDEYIGQKHLACSSIWQQGKHELHITYVDGDSVLKQQK